MSAYRRRRASACRRDNPDRHDAYDSQGAGTTAVTTGCRCTASEGSSAIYANGCTEASEARRTPTSTEAEHKHVLVIPKTLTSREQGCAWQD